MNRMPEPPSVAEKVTSTVLVPMFAGGVLLNATKGTKVSFVHTRSFGTDSAIAWYVAFTDSEYMPSTSTATI